MRNGHEVYLQQIENPACQGGGLLNLCIRQSKGTFGVSRMQMGNENRQKSTDELLPYISFFCGCGTFVYSISTNILRCEWKLKCQNCGRRYECTDSIIAAEIRVSSASHSSSSGCRNDGKRAITGPVAPFLA